MTLSRAQISVNGWTGDAVGADCGALGGAPLKPFTRYTAALTAVDNAGETAAAALTFETGRMGTAWAGKVDHRRRLPVHGEEGLPAAHDLP